MTFEELIRLDLTVDQVVLIRRALGELAANASAQDLTRTSKEVELLLDLIREQSGHKGRRMM